MNAQDVIINGHEKKPYDELFWGKDLKDVFYQDEILQMVAKIQEYDEDKLFKITRLNLQGKTKDWYRSLNSAPLDWQTLQIIMMEKKWGV